MLSSKGFSSQTKIEALEYNENSPTAEAIKVLMDMSHMRKHPTEVKITSCNAPKPERLLRKLDDKFVKGLKQRMKEDPIAPSINTL